MVKGGVNAGSNFVGNRSVETGSTTLAGSVAKGSNILTRLYPTATSNDEASILYQASKALVIG
jgi:hypothetical protein